MAVILSRPQCVKIEVFVIIAVNIEAETNKIAANFLPTISNTFYLMEIYINFY